MNIKFFMLNSLGIIRCCESIISACLCDKPDIVEISNWLNMIKFYEKNLKEVILIETEESQSERK